VKGLLALLMVVVVSFSSYAATSIFDDFNDGVIDTAKWQVILPFGSSQVLENSGFVQSISRGVLATKGDVDSSVQISGKFMFVAQDPKISFRSDLSGWDGYGERTGVTLAFGFNGQNIRLEGRWGDGSSGTIGVEKPYAWQSGIYYDFEVNDDGNNIEVFINGLSVVSGATTQRMGSRVGFFGNEMSGMTARFDDISIQGIPEPSSLSLLALCGVVVALRRRKK
jgi:hypothetical protein